MRSRTGCSSATRTSSAAGSTTSTKRSRLAEPHEQALRRLAGSSARGMARGAAGARDGGHPGGARSRLWDVERREPDPGRPRAESFLVGRRVRGAGLRHHGEEGAWAPDGACGPARRAAGVHGGALAPRGRDAGAPGREYRWAESLSGTDRTHQGTPILLFRSDARLGREETVGRAGGAPRDGARRGRRVRRRDAGALHPGRAPDSAAAYARVARRQRVPLSHRVRVRDLRVKGDEEARRGIGGANTLMGNLDREKVAKEWKARGFSCDLWVDPPGQIWEDYVHSTDELLMLMEGKLELGMQGKTFCPAVGEEVLIPAHNSHTVRNTGGTTARWLYGYKT